MAELGNVMHKEVGGIQEMSSEYKEFEWRVFSYNSLPDKNQKRLFYDSPLFTLRDDSFCLGFFLNCETNSLIELKLLRDLKRDYSVEYTVGLKRKNGNVVQLLCGILKGDEKFRNFSSITDNTELLRCKSESGYFEMLTFTCALKLKTYSKLPNQTKPLKLISLEKLSDNYKNLFGNKETCDMTLKVKDIDYRAHRLVLIAQSSVFAATFKHDSLESQTGVINIPDCDPDSFQQFLDYLYSGKLEEISVNSALNLYYTSDKYDVQELKAFCVKYLMQSLTIENVSEIAVLADKYDEMELYSAVQEFFSKNVFDIFQTTEWNNLLTKDHHLVSKLLKDVSKMKKSEATPLDSTKTC